MEPGSRAPQGVLEPVAPDAVLPALRCSYLYPESRTAFTYSSPLLVRNGTLLSRYTEFRAERRGAGYAEKQLEESWGFLLLDDESGANELGRRGLLTGHSTCSIIGDPTKGVYVSKYSDCLDLRRWHYGKSGHIAVLKLTKGRVKAVTENYTLNPTPPSVGFDCHQSAQLEAVTSTTSSFLAFERTRYYMYEFQSGETATVTCPRHVCPFAVVPFSYGRVAPLLSELQDKSHKEIVFHYRPWNGELVINSLVYNVGLKSSTRALIPAKLPKRVEIKSVIRVSDLQKLLPDAVFESPPSGEATVEGQCYSLHELVSAEPEDAAPLVLLARELKDKQVALVLPLNDCGVLVILHSSCFSSCEDGNSGTREALHGMFIFLESRTIQKDTKNGQKASVIPPEILRVVPALNYAEAALENSGLPRDGEVKSLLERHIQSYETLVPRGAQASPGHSPLPEWNETSRQKMSSYFSQPCSYEFPCQKATALLSGGREQRTGDYRGPSSPEDPGPLSPAASRAEPHPQADAVDYGEDTGVSKQDRCGGAAPFSNEEDHGKPETSVARKASTTSGDVPREMVMTITSSSPSGGTGEAVICADVGTNVKPFTKAKPRRGRRRRRKRPTNPKLNKVGPTPTTKMASPALPTRAGCEPAVRAEPGAAEDAVLREEGAEEHVPKAPSLPPPHTQDHLQKRKVDRYSLRLGLKSIVTSCGKLFVPHGSKVDSGKRSSDQVLEPIHGGSGSPSVPEEGPFSRLTGDCGAMHEDAPSGPSGLWSPALQSNSDTSPSGGQSLKKDATNHSNAIVPATPDRKGSPPQKSKKSLKDREYTVISISQLRTVLKRGKRVHSGEPELKKTKVTDALESRQEGAGPRGPEKVPQAAARDSDIPQVSPDTTEQLPGPEQRSAPGEQAREVFRSERTQAKRSAPSPDAPKTPRKQRRTKANEVSKENECLEFDASASNDIGSLMDPKQDEESLKLNAEGQGETSVCSVEKAAVTSTYLPADALNLLADLALSSNGDKVPHGKCGLKQAVRAKSCPDPESVLHVLLKRPAGPARRPAKSPFPEGLVVAREWALVITKDHAYCQASSLLSAAPPSAGQECVTLLDPGGDPVKRPGQCERRLDEPGCKDARRTRVRVRHVVVKGDSVQVTRQWKEPYDFGFDSRFTNEPKEKTVGRALHGRWNVDMEDTDEQILLIFHTWVGLFYSRSTSRFFQIDPDCLKLRDRKATRDDQKIELFHMSALYNANVQPATRSNVAAARIPKSGDERANVAEPHPSDVLDLSLRSSGAFNGSPAKRKEVPEADAGSVGTCLVSSTEADRLVDAGESRPPEPATGPGFEAYRVSGGAAMCDEEDTAETRDLDGGSGSGSENDSVTSYAEVLDGSSAYHQLCQQTADLWKCAGTSSRLTEDVSPHAPCDAIVPVKGDSGGAAVREPVTTTPVDVTTELSEPSAEDEGTQSGTLHNGSGEGGPEDDEAIRDDRPNIGRCGTERENEDLPQDSGGSQGHSEILPVDTACEEGTSTLVPVERRFEGGENKDELIVDDRTECENECERTVETGTGKDASEDLPRDLEDGPNRSEILPVDGMSEEEKREGNGENRDEIIIDDLSNSEQSWSECETECETECEGTAEASEDPSCDLEGGQTHSEILFNDSVSEEMSMLVQEKRDDSGENKDDITMDAHEDIPSEGDQGCSDILPCVKQTSVDDSGEKINSEVNVCLEMDSRAEHRSETGASVLDMTTIVHARSFAEDNWEITETHAGLLTHGCSFEESRKEDVNIPLVPSQATHEDDRAQIPEPEEASRDSECPLHSKDLPVEDLSQRSLPANKEMSSNDGPDPADLEKAGHLDGFSVYGLDLSKYAKPGTSLHNNPSSCTKDLYETDDSSHSDQNLMQTEYDDEGYEGTFNYLSGDEGVQDYSVKTLCLRYKKQSSKKTGFTLEPAEEHTSRTDLKDKSSGMSAPFLNKHLLYGAKESDLNGSWSDEHVESPPRVRRSQRTMAKDMGHEHEQFSSSECGSSKTLHPKRSERHRIHESNLEAELQEMELDHDPFHQSEKKSYTALDYRMGGTFFHPRQSISPLDEPEHEPEPYWDHTSIMAARRRKGPKEGLGLKLEQEVFSAPEPATVTSVVVDSKGNRTIFEGHPSREAAVRSRSQTVKKTCHRGTRRYVERFLRRWDALHQDGPDVTQASMDREFLIFSQKMKQILKTTRRPSHHAVKRGRGKDRNVSEGSAAPARRGRRDLPRLRRDRAGEAAAQSFRSTMAEVCSGKGDAARRGRLQERQDPPRPQSSRNVVSCGDQTRRDFKRPRHDTDSVVRRACKMKYKFYILVTSADPFFRETKELLELEGHTEVHPEEFDLHGSSSPSTLLVILKNEDIARHICEVPNLLELKKSSGVLFAGIDRPDDVVKLTHQELFCRGGFVVFDGAALRTLSLENMKEVTRFLEELGTRGRWRWFLHYRDSRWLRESSRSSREAQNMKHFMDRCRDAGVVEVLPFHDCDSVSCERPDYLRCLTSLQVQNAATRFPVFVTDTPADSFGRNGIFTINMNTFSQSISRDSCTVS